MFARAAIVAVLIICRKCSGTLQLRTQGAALHVGLSKVIRDELLSAVLVQRR
jgi:hypothetical protein